MLNSAISVCVVTQFVCSTDIEPIYFQQDFDFKNLTHLSSYGCLAIYTGTSSVVFFVSVCAIVYIFNVFLKWLHALMNVCLLLYVDDILLIRRSSKGLAPCRFLCVLKRLPMCPRRSLERVILTVRSSTKVCNHVCVIASCR